MSDNMPEGLRKYGKPVFAAVLSLLILLSFSCGAKYFASPDRISEQVEYLDEKRATVAELAGASTAASLAITALPGDIATPIAEKLADLSGWFLLIFGAIFLEKYLLSVTALAAFRFIFPAAGLLMLAYLLLGSTVLRRLAARLLALGAALWLLIPGSIALSQTIEETYRSSADNAISVSIESVGEMDEETENTDSAEQNWWQSVWQTAKSAAAKAADSVTGIPEKLTELLNRFIEAVAVMLVTSCVIPVLILLLFLWVIRLFLGIGLPRETGFVPQSFRRREKADMAEPRSEKNDT